MNTEIKLHFSTCIYGLLFLLVFLGGNYGYVRLHTCAMQLTDSASVPVSKALTFLLSQKHPVCFHVLVSFVVSLIACFLCRKTRDLNALLLTALLLVAVVSLGLMLILTQAAFACIPIIYDQPEFTFLKSVVFSVVFSVHLFGVFILVVTRKNKHTSPPSEKK